MEVIVKYITYESHLTRQIMKFNRDQEGGNGDGFNPCHLPTQRGLKVIDIEEEDPFDYYPLST